MDRERDRDVVRDDDLRRGHREELRAEAPVIREDDPLRLLAALDDVPRDTVCAAPDVFEGVVIGDLRAPAVRSKHDRRLRRGLGNWCPSHSWTRLRRAL